MWRIIGESVAGTAHTASAIHCQDYNSCECLVYGEREILVAIASDGAGSARFGKTGSQIACNNMYVCIQRLLGAWDGDLGKITCETVKKWLGRTRHNLKQTAARTLCSVRDYACTIVGVVADENAIVCFQIGDGAIVVETQQQPLRAVFWPDNGEYANETCFLTDEDFAQHLQFKRIAETPVDIAILSDGLQRLALDYETREPHQPFFTPMFAQLAFSRQVKPQALKKGLAAFLSSDQVNSRTDDDKTLVLATRRPFTQA